MVDSAERACYRSKGQVDRLLGARQAAAYLGIAPESVHRLTRAGALPCAQTPQGRRYRPADLDAYAARRTPKSAPTPAQHQPASSSPNTFAAGVDQLSRFVSLSPQQQAETLVIGELGRRLAMEEKRLADTQRYQAEQGARLAAFRARQQQLAAGWQVVNTAQHVLAGEWSEVLAALPAVRPQALPGVWSSGAPALPPALPPRQITGQARVVDPPRPGLVQRLFGSKGQPAPRADDVTLPAISLDDPVYRR